MCFGAEPSEAHPTTLLTELRRVPSSQVIPRWESGTFAKEGKILALGINVSFSLSFYFLGHIVWSMRSFVFAF